MFIDGINRTKKRDSTLLQRARWFGYREKIFNETKVCLKEQTVENFIILREINKEIKKQLKSYNFILSKEKKKAIMQSMSFLERDLIE